MKILEDLTDEQIKMLFNIKREYLEYMKTNGEIDSIRGRVNAIEKELKPIEKAIRPKYYG